jgi:Tfp pilus assembly protein PilN
MTQVNLLPGDVRQRQRTRALTLAVLASVAGVLALVLFVFVLQTARLSSAKHELASQESVNDGLRSDIAGLQQFAQLKQTVADRVALRDDLLRSQVLWSGILRDLSMVIPGKVYLTSMSGTVTDVSQSPSLPAGDLVGTIQFQGVATDQPTVALWLTRLEQVDGWVNAWISQSSKANVNGVDKVQFSGTIDVSLLATSDGGPQ